MNGEGIPTLREVRYFTSRLLFHAAVLPSDLAAMLQEYKSELGHTMPEKWASMGNLTMNNDLARRIGQAIADGEWPPGTNLDWPLIRLYCWDQTRETAMSALQLLTIRGELVLRGGNYYVRPRDESS